jgi:hypothetical protein
MDYRGLDTDPGWINRKFQELQRSIEALRSEKRAGATTVNGDLTVENGGNVVVQDGGSMRVTDSGDINVMHPDGVTAAIRLGDQSFAAYGIDGSTLLELAMSSHPAYPVLDNYLAVTGLEYIVLQNVSGGSSLVLATASTPPAGIRITLAAGENFQLVDLPTTSNSPNLTVDASTGIVARSTSSMRYKLDITDHEVDPQAVLRMRVRTWRDRAETENDPDTTHRYVGLIAEELHDLGLGEFVSYDDQGRPDAISYDRIPVALLAVLKDQQARLEALEDKVAQLVAAPTTSTTDAPIQRST